MLLSYLLHQSVGFEEDFDDTLVVDEVGVGELASFTIFEPLLSRLVAADVEVPGEFGHVAKILSFVDPDFAVDVADLFDRAIAWNRKGGLVIIHDGGAHQVEFTQFAPEGHQAVKLSLGGDGDAREINPKKLNIPIAIARTMQLGIDKVKNIFGGRNGS